MYKPLADELRPTSLQDIVGQNHILGPNGILRRMIESGKIPNMIFYGPSGTGKTTVAEIVSKKINRPLHRLNATTASISDIKDIVSDIGTLMAPDGIVLYLDEIQYFNKKQQQALLEFIEKGSILLIASTTENPHFYVYHAILSRSTVFEFKPIEDEEMIPALSRSVSFMETKLGRKATVEDGVLLEISSSCGGDVRKGIGMIEALFFSMTNEAEILITFEDIVALTGRAGIRYDKNGDQHYDILSAFQKSIRGSDPDASLHYLARMLEAGNLISACRRLLVIASEDIGLAHPQAITIVKSCVDAAHMLGLPEARIPLAQATVLLATAPKSNSSYVAIDDAIADITSGNIGEVPNHLKDTHYKGARKLGRGLTYNYPHKYEKHYTKQQYLPDKLLGKQYYQYGNNKVEQLAKKYWDEIKHES